jgi:hypothetical protein
MKLLLSILIITLLFSCKNESDKDIEITSNLEEVIYTRYSTAQNEYSNFNSVNAINKIAEIENEYFESVEKGISRYYGTVWREQAERIMINDSISQYQDYLNQLKTGKADSLHCTLYAYEGLKAGLTKTQLIQLEKLHKEIWKSREIAGWSIGFLLVKYFDWKAYLLLHPDSNEYENCIKSFERNKSYAVWKQPNIPLEEIFIVGEEDTLINNLLMKHEFGWGFSEQGIHTWITRHNKLKECNWLGTPSKKYATSKYEKPLFLTTGFKNYFDYNSHVIVVPRKK